MPHWDVASAHETRVDAPPERVYASVWEADLGASPVSRMLFAIRGGRFAKPATQSALTLRTMLRSGFTLLGERPNDQILIGLIGKPWQPAYEVRPFEASEFMPFEEPGYAKVAWDFRVLGDGPFTRLSTRTRVSCTDLTSLQRFRLYWVLTAPFSGLIRKEMLRIIKGLSQDQTRGQSSQESNRGPF